MIEKKNLFLTFWQLKVNKGAYAAPELKHRPFDQLQIYRKKSSESDLLQSFFRYLYTTDKKRGSI